MYVILPLLDKPYISNDWAKMWYKNSHSVGIKRKTGDIRQIFSFGGKKTKLSESTLLQLGEESLKKLDAGLSEDEVKEWVLRMVAE